GKRVAVAGRSTNPPSGFVSVLDVETKKELFATKLVRAATSVAFSPDGRHLAYADLNSKAELLAADTGKVVFTLRLDGPARVCFAPDGRSLATATEAKTVQLWDAATGEEQAKFRGATVRLLCVAFSPDGKRIAAAGGEARPGALGSAFVWDLVTERGVARGETGPGAVAALAFAPDGSLLATGGADGQVRMWDVATARVKAAIGTRGPVNGLAFSPGGRVLAGAAFDGSVRLWDPASGEEVGALSGHP